MSKHHPKDDITFKETTVACPKMTRRFYAAAGAEFTAWLWLQRARAREEYDRLPQTVSDDTAAWVDGMRGYLHGKIRVLDWLISAVPDRFPVVEWNNAVMVVSRWLDEPTNSDPTGTQKLTEQFDPDLRGNDGT